MYLTEVLNKINSSKLNCTGASKEEITKAEKRFQQTFPKAYKEFLSICGNDNGDLFCGDVVTLKSLEYVNKEGKEVYQEALGKPCPKDAFFILEHQGYSFYYFVHGNNENPDLFLLVHGDEVYHDRFGKFSDLIEKDLRRTLTH